MIPAWVVAILELASALLRIAREPGPPDERAEQDLDHLVARAKHALALARAEQRGKRG